MKNLFVLLLFVVGTASSYAQTNNIVNAYNYMQSGELYKARGYIEKAAVHIKTKEKPKTWKYRGDIYYRIFSSTLPEDKTLESNPASIAFDSYKKAKELYVKDKKIEISDIDQKLGIMQNIVLNRGVSDYNERKYELAFSKFETSAGISEYLGAIDSLAAFNCALASERGGKNERAIKWYRKCMEINYRAPDCCSIVILLLKKENRENEAIAQIQKCRTKFPNDYNLIKAELNYHLKSGDYVAATKNLKKAIEFEPKNSELYFTLGTALDKQGISSEAINSYLKAIELDSNYFDAYYNLGALYFNQAVEFNNQANNALDLEKANLIKNKATMLFKQAVPYLEKASTLNPSNKNTLNTLKALYARLGNTEKYQEIDKLLKNL